MHLSSFSWLFLLVAVALAIGCQHTARGPQGDSRPTDGGAITSRDKAISVAEAYAAQAGLVIPKNSNAAVTKLTDADNAITVSAHQSDYRERIRRTLEGKTYWMVLYKSGEELGGEFVFFVDEKTGAVLSHYAGK